MNSTSTIKRRGTNCNNNSYSANESKKMDNAHAMNNVNTKNNNNDLTNANTSNDNKKENIHNE